MGRNRTLKVNIHDPNTRLFVGGIDKTKGKEQIVAAISQQTGEIILFNISVFEGIHRKGISVAQYCNISL